ncbi:metallophosphoesterase [Microbacterium excoecariae]|uniref:metallophosphoesterase n=1 Tax=Microbacterium excoecariae TaxID=2715210 RepID=UPI001409748C|nr:metallophosphoesterase [Microbacterium excoecariae]NHI17566.1 metallophosphoesterase [Microbacterium excoecariae]
MGAGRGALTAVAAAGALAAAWGIGIERYRFRVRTHTVRILAPGSDPIRVLHLSDLHLAPWQRRKREWIARLASLRPDLVIDTGDNFGHPAALGAIRGALTPFAGTPGVHVHGSNDIWAPKPRNPLRYLIGPSQKEQSVPPLDTDGLDAVLEGELGWFGLHNDGVAFDVRGHRLRFIGTDDPHHDREDWDAVDAARGELPDGELTIGVTHAPYRRVLDAFVDRGADAIFAGHTHGGQVRIPGVGALVANCDIPLAQARGLSAWEHDGRSAVLNVSAGVGHSIYAPVRFACPPEVSLVTLAPKRPA